LSVDGVAKTGESPESSMSITEHHLRRTGSNWDVLPLKSGCAMPDPTAPQGKGKIERFFRTVRSQFLPELADELPLDEINRLFQHYVENGYHQRIHGGTGAEAS
jgi:hypothetical protein